MAWAGTAVARRDNEVPNGVIYITVRFVDGDRSFSRDYKLVPGRFTSADEIRAFIDQEADQMNALETAVDSLVSASEA